MTNKEIYRRKLPHLQPLGAAFFVTYNLQGSLPKPLLEKLQAAYEQAKAQMHNNNITENEAYPSIRKIYFKNQDDFLDKQSEGPHHLKDERIAAEIVNSLHYWDGKKLELISYCIMSNHVHVVLRLYGSNETDIATYLNKVMHSIKSISAKKANAVLESQGQFWPRESFDYLIRDKDELYRIISSVLDNPVRAGLCSNRKDWKWSYINEAYNEFM